MFEERRLGASRNYGCFFGAPLAEIPENSTFAVPKGKISRKTQRSGRAVFPIAIGSTGLENQTKVFY
jgi:hypothetical protein